MGLIKRPSELEITPTLAAMIYGDPGAGKTTLGCSAPKPVLFDFDGGVTRINYNHQVDSVQVKTWEEAVAAFEEAKAARYQTIVIDTVGKMLGFIEDYIKRTQPNMVQRDGTLSLKGFGIRKNIFKDFTQSVKRSGLNVVYLAHVMERKDTIGRQEITVKRPEIGGSSTNDLMKELDLVGYMEIYGTNRVVTFDPSEQFYGKNCCGLYGPQTVPCIIDSQDKATAPNDFLSKVIDSYKARLKESHDQHVRYEAKVADIRQRAAAVSNAEDANAFIKWMQGEEPLFDSRNVALAAMTARAKELGLVFSNVEKKYSDGNDAA